MYIYIYICMRKMKGSAAEVGGPTPVLKDSKTQVPGKVPLRKVPLSGFPHARFPARAPSAHGAHGTQVRDATPPQQSRNNPTGRRFGESRETTHISP